MSSVKSESLTLPIWMPFIYFRYLIAEKTTAHLLVCYLSSYDKYTSYSFKNIARLLITDFLKLNKLNKFGVSLHKAII